MQARGAVSPVDTPEARVYHEDGLNAGFGAANNLDDDEMLDVDGVPSDPQWLVQVALTQKAAYTYP